MGRADGRIYHPGGGQKGNVVVAVNKRLAPERRRWVLTHEAAHVIDCTSRKQSGERIGHPCFLGFGRLSAGIYHELGAHREFLTGLTKHVERYNVDGLSYTMDELLAAPEIDGRLKRRIRMKAFDASVRRLGYKNTATELFAEAIACALCEPPRLDMGAPGLREVLRRVAGPEGFPL